MSGIQMNLDLGSSDPHCILLELMCPSLFVDPQVRQAVKDALLKHGNFQDETVAEKYLQKMELENRYQTETWS